MISLSPLFYIIGILLSMFASAMTIPLVTDFLGDDPNWKAFLLSLILSGTLGVILFLANKPRHPIELSVRQAFLLTTLTWGALCLASSLPFVFSRSTDTYTDSLFEAVSAITTTGATILNGLEYSSAGILLWRAILQWLGGIGIIVMALTILPVLQIGGMQLFRSEFSDRSEKILPRVSQIASALFTVYIGFTLVCIASFWLAGMTFLEAVCHAMSAISTGGLSTADSSFNYFDDALIEVIAIIFMIIGGSTLILFVHMFRGDMSSFWKDSQIKVYLWVLFVFIATMTLWKWLHEGLPFTLALRKIAFNVVSVMTTCGFANDDFGHWTGFPLLAIFMLMFVGGCTGSTAGGIKIFRFQIIYALAKSQIYRLRHPHGVFIPTYNGQPIREGIFDSIFTFFALYGGVVVLLIIGLSFYELDFITCLSSVIACVGNVGPGIGDVVGPSANYASLPDGVKWLLMLGMILGRLEFMTVLIIATPAFWRR